MADLIEQYNSVVPVDQNYTYELLATVIDNLVAKYPYIEMGMIGRSVMGKDIYYLKLGKGTREVCYNASFHANENITAGPKASGNSIHRFPFPQAGRLISRVWI